MLKLTTKRTKWFPVTQDPSGETMVEIVHLKPGEVADIEAKSNRITGKQFGDDFQTEIDFSLNDRLKAYVTRSITDWKGFLDIKDKPLPCSDANKLKVLAEFDWFGEFVEECRETLAEEVATEEEDAEKN